MIRSLHTKRDDKGVVALEMVMIIPILVMLIVGVAVLGTALSVQAQTVGLAHQGARAAALGNDLPDNTEITEGQCSSPPAPTDTKNVTVRATKPVLLRSIPFLPLLRENHTAWATMRCGA